MPLQREAGFSLLEALIALLVFSTGILGVAAMHTGGMRFTHGAQNLSIGTLLADDMAERMRANLQGVQAGDYDNRCVCNGDCADEARAGNCGSVLSTCPEDVSAIDRSCYGSACAASSAVRTADFNSWLVNVCETTPPGTLAGVFCSGTCDQGASRSIVVSWLDREASGDETESSHAVELSYQPIDPKS